MLLFVVFALFALCDCEGNVPTCLFKYHYFNMGFISHI
jgi:hypothetical protein